MRKSSLLISCAIIALTSTAVYGQAFQGPANIVQPTTANDCVKVQTTGSNTLVDTGAICGGAGGTPGGSNTQLQYNNSSAFGGITGATTDGTVVTLNNPTLTGTTTSGNIVIPASGILVLGSASGSGLRFTNTADGQLTLTNGVGTGFTRLLFGGTSSSFGSLQTNGTETDSELANGSGLAPFGASAFMAGSPTGGNEGSGTINVSSAYYVNGTQIGPTNLSGLGTGVATLLSGTSSGTGGPAGTVSPAFTGTASFSVLTASSNVNSGSFRGGSGTAASVIIESTSGAGTTDNLTLKTGSQVTGFNMDTNQLITLPRISSDTAHTDASVCEDTTTHALYSGSGTLGVCLGTSSSRYKTNILDIPLGLDTVMSLVPKQYSLDADHGDPTKTYYGFLAEDGEVVVPNLIGLDSNGQPNTFDYLGLVPVMVKSIQQMQAEIIALGGKPQ